MNGKWLIAGLSLLVAFPAALAAQEPPRERDRVRVYTWNENRGRIGVIVNTEADGSTDRLGARIEAVTPGAPADRAGIKAGDIITKFNDTALGGARAENADESGPGMKLLELARALEPGDTVRIEFRRGNDTKSATLVAEDLGWGGVVRGGPVFALPDIREIPEMEDARRSVELAFGPWGSPWSGVEFVTLGPELGEYFGVREGLLVVKVRADSAMPLKPGDVILSIDGRKPSSASHALRILRSYEASETVRLEIQRKQRRETVTWTVPERELRRRVTPRAPRAPRPERSDQG
jgi:S1-C subfamily serine protease